MLRIAIHGDLTLAGRKLHCQYVGAREPKSAPQITILNMPVAGRKKKKLDKGRESPGRDLPAPLPRVLDHAGQHGDDDDGEDD